MARAVMTSRTTAAAEVATRAAMARRDATRSAAAITSAPMPRMPSPTRSLPVAVTTSEAASTTSPNHVIARALAGPVQCSIDTPMAMIPTARAVTRPGWVGSSTSREPWRKAVAASEAAPTWNNRRDPDRRNSRSGLSAVTVRATTAAMNRVNSAANWSCAASVVMVCR